MKLRFSSVGTSSAILAVLGIGVSVGAGLGGTSERNIFLGDDGRDGLALELEGDEGQGEDEVLPAGAAAATADASSSSSLPASPLYSVRACLAAAPGDPCASPPLPVPVRYLTQPVANPDRCEDTVGQRGSLSFADLALPQGEALLVEVTTNVAGRDGGADFFVRPSRLTAPWGVPSVDGNVASFYLGGTGQFSVEFAPSSLWRSGQHLASSWSKQSVSFRRRHDLYDWGMDTVFHVLDDTAIHFEPGSRVRARIVQTKQKVNNVLISGYGLLDNHYPPVEYDVPGVTDDGSRQAIHILGTNVKVHGLTIVNTNAGCAEFGYALNVNANWAPLQAYEGREPVFEAGELQNADPPYLPRKAHCQERHMDDAPNTDFSNCPTTREDGAEVSFVKAISWQMGQDGINAGKYGTVRDSFVRVVDDSLKPWDSELDDQRWLARDEIGTVRRGGHLREQQRQERVPHTQVGLEINKAAYSRHLTPEGCVGSIKDAHITNLFFDEEFYQIGSRTNNFLRGERDPNPGCVGDYAGQISNMVISGKVNGRDLSVDDFVIPRKHAGTVPGLVFQTVDPITSTSTTTSSTTTSSFTTTPVVTTTSTTSTTAAATTAQPPITTTTTATTSTTIAAPVTTTALVTTTASTTTSTTTPTSIQVPQTTAVPKVTVKVQIETPYNPSKVDWKIKIGTAVVASGIASGDPSEEFVELDAQTLYKFVIVDRNSVKDERVRHLAPAQRRRRAGARRRPRRLPLLGLRPLQVRPQLRPSRALPPHHGLLLLDPVPVSARHPLHPVVEEAVRRRASSQVLPVGIRARATRVVVPVPLPVEPVLRVGGVVSESDVPLVVRHGVQVVQGVDPASALLGPGEVPVDEGIGHRTVDLRPKSGRPELEPLQVHDQDGGEHEQVDLLRRLHALLARGTAPPIVPREQFLLAEELEAVVERLAPVRHGEGEVHERVEADADAAAPDSAVRHPPSTSHRVPQLSLEQVHDDGLVPSQVVRPGRDGVPLVVGAVAVLVLHVRFDFHPIEVLVDPVQQKRQQLLGVLLLVPLELRRELRQVGLERPRVVRRPRSQPEVLRQLGVARHERASRAEEVLAVDLGAVVVPQEVIREGDGVRQTLEAAVHEARVAQVGQPHPPGAGVAVVSAPGTVASSAAVLVRGPPSLDAPLDDLVHVLVGRRLVLFQRPPPPPSPGRASSVRRRPDAPPRSPLPRREEVRLPRALLEDAGSDPGHAREDAVPAPVVLAAVAPSAVGSPVGPSPIARVGGLGEVVEVASLPPPPVGLGGGGGEAVSHGDGDRCAMYVTADGDRATGRPGGRRAAGGGYEMDLGGKYFA
ncbi:hypothetical protein ACHAWF_012767 [Thalassiosira exigua]